MIVVIDPGHSGAVEPGAVHGDILESTVALDIAKRVQHFAEICMDDVKIYLTRSGDIQTDDLAFRSQLANDLQADLFISLHCDSFADAGAQGYTVFNYPGSVVGGQFADVLDRLVGRCNGEQVASRGCKTANFQVLRETNCPAVLLECGFLSNDSDRAALVSPDYQILLTVAIVGSIMSYSYMSYLYGVRRD